MSFIGLGKTEAKVQCSGGTVPAKKSASPVQVTGKILRIDHTGGNTRVKVSGSMDAEAKNGAGEGTGLMSNVAQETSKFLRKQHNQTPQPPPPAQVKARSKQRKKSPMSSGKEKAKPSLEAQIWFSKLLLANIRPTPSPDLFVQPVKHVVDGFAPARSSDVKHNSGSDKDNKGRIDVNGQAERHLIASGSSADQAHEQPEQEVGPSSGVTVPDKGDGSDMLRQVDNESWGSLDLLPSSSGRGDKHMPETDTSMETPEPNSVYQEQGQSDLNDHFMTAETSEVDTPHSVSDLEDGHGGSNGDVIDSGHVEVSNGHSVFIQDNLPLNTDLFLPLHNDPTQDFQEFKMPNINFHLPAQDSGMDQKDLGNGFPVDDIESWEENPNVSSKAFHELFSINQESLIPDPSGEFEEGMQTRTPLESPSSASQALSE